MKRRIFIAIIPPEKIQKQLSDYQKKFRHLNVRWIKQKNLHFTLLFIGWIEEEKIEIIKRTVKEVSQRINPFVLELKEITLGPDLTYPKMIWAVGKPNEQLIRLSKQLKEKLSQEKISFDQRHPLKVHLTLGRAKRRQYLKEKIKQRINIAFSVREIKIMESQLKREGADYSVLESFPLKGQ